MNRFHFLHLIVLVLVFSALLSACGTAKTEPPSQDVSTPTTEPSAPGVSPPPTEPVMQTEPAPESFTIQLSDDSGETFFTAIAGEDLTLPEPVPPEGYVFYAWLDQEGAIVDDHITVTGDISIFARYLPALTDAGHAPYLTMDASWRTRPEEPVSHAELIDLFASLISIPAESGEGEEAPTSKTATEETESEEYIKTVALLRKLGGIRSESFSSADPTTQEELFSILTLFFPEESGSYFFANIDSTDELYPVFSLAAAHGWLADTESDPAEMLTRLDFAKIMNDVLHRTADPDYLDAAREVLFDLPEDDTDALTLIEATIRHRCSENGERELWSEIELPERPFADFTTGDLEVDGWIKQILEEKLTEEMTLKEKLAVLYRYVRDTSRYRKGDIHEEADKAWVLAETRKMMETGGGNCFTYSSTLCELYRALGIDVRIYAGTISENNNPHAWVEGTIDGTVYIFDVEMEATRMRFQHPYVDFFMRTYYDLKGWDYKRDFVVDWD